VIPTGFKPVSLDFSAQDKENVKVHCLRELDKTKYEIYDVLQSAVAQSKKKKKPGMQL
jgi:hypothetical protein